MIPVLINKRAASFAGVFLLYLSLMVGAFPQVMFLGETFVRRDILRYYYPVWHYSWQNLSQGHIPLWNPLVSMGAPHLANVQTCVFYPPALLFLLPDFTWAFNFYILLHLAAAGFFTYLWIKSCGASPAAAFFSGLVFSFGGFMMATINLTISLCTAAYFPLVLLCLRRVLRERSFTAKAVLAVVLAFQYLAGDPSIFFISVLVCAVFVAYRFFERRVETGEWDRKPIIGFVQTGLLFLGLAAVQWPLFAEFLMQSHRKALPFDQRSMWSIQYNDLLSIIVPFFSDLSMYVMDYWVRQSWLENYYCGISVCVLALTAFFYRKEKNVGYHILLVFFSASLFLGRFSGVYLAFYKFIPFFSFIRYPVRFFFLFSFAVACLAGLSLDRLLNARQGKAGRLFFLVGAVVAAAFVFALFFDMIEGRVWEFVRHTFEKVVRPFYGTEDLRDFMDVTLRNIRRSLLIGAMTFAAIAAVKYTRLNKGLAAFFFIALAATDLFASNVYEPTIPSKGLLPPPPVVQALRKDESLYRIWASPRMARMHSMHYGEGFEEELGRQKDTMAPDLMMLYGIQDASGYDSIYLRRMRDFEYTLTNLRSPDSRFLDMMNVKYVVSPAEKIKGDFEVFFKTRFSRVFLNKNTLPRALLSRKAERLSFRETMKKLLSGDYDARNVIYLEETPPVPLAVSASSAEDSVEKAVYSPERLEFRTFSAGERWLFLSDTFYPGWKAEVDGKPSRIYAANHAFRAVVLSPGAHTVRMTYDPPLFKWGAAVSLLTALAMVICVFKQVHLK